VACVRFMFDKTSLTSSYGRPADIIFLSCGFFYLFFFA